MGWHILKKVKSFGNTFLFARRFMKIIPNKDCDNNNKDHPLSNQQQ
jgi:hypothetical protein